MWRRVIEVVCLGLFWMCLWGAIGALLSIVIGVIDPPSIDEGEGPIDMARLIGGAGGVAGLLFGLLSAIRRSDEFSNVPILRAVLLGVLAGVILPLGTPLNDPLVFNTAPLGALAALLSVLLARSLRPRGRGAPGDPATLAVSPST